MGILSNFIGAAAGAGGEIMQRQREADVDLAKQKSYADYASELDLKKQTALEALRQEYKIGDEGRAETRTIAGEQRGLLNRATERQTIVDESVRNAPKLREVKVEDAKATEMAKLDPAIQARKLQVWKDDFVTKTEAELKADITRLNDPKYLAGKAKEAAAGRDPNSAALHRVQLEAAQMALKEKQEEAKIPAAVKDEIAGLRELIKGKSAIIDKATVEGTATPEGLAKMEAEKSAMAARVSQLRNNYLPEGLRATDKPAAGGPDVKYDAQGNAYVRGPDGKPMLQSSPGKANPPANPQGAARDKPAAAQFNEAGYADVQGTIDGAKRGDAKALELLRKMIARGETNPGQRDQIAKLLNK